jgi:hypothetical protein
MGFISTYMYIIYFNCIHFLYHPLFSPCTGPHQIVPLLHSWPFCLHVYLCFKSRFCLWEKICNICLSESGLFCLTWWPPVPLILLQILFFMVEWWQLSFEWGYGQYLWRHKCVLDWEALVDWGHVRVQNAWLIKRLREEEPEGEWVPHLKSASLLFSSSTFSSHYFSVLSWNHVLSVNQWYLPQ